MLLPFVLNYISEYAQNLPEDKYRYILFKISQIKARNQFEETFKEDNHTIKSR